VVIAVGEPVHNFDVLLESSSLGAPGAQQLRARTSRSQARAIRRIGEARDRAGDSGAGRANLMNAARLSGLVSAGGPGGSASAHGGGEGDGELSEMVGAGPNPVVRRLQLGTQLRQLRLECGLLLQAAAAAVGLSETKISRMELGRVGFKRADVAALLTLYGVEDAQERAGFLSLAREANAPGWWQQYYDVLPSWFSTFLGLEGSASTIRSYDVQCVPALLQTEDYARVVCGSVGVPRVSQIDVERRVELRMKRQELFQAQGGRVLHAVVDEGALRRPFGDSAVMRRQLEHLIESSERPDVCLQVMPFSSSGHPVASGPFTLFSFCDTDVPDVVFIEQLDGAVYLDKPEHTGSYADVLEGLQRDSPSPRNSRELLRGLLNAA
jgi:transcriptional regulator with XRE-family HTH domain